MLSRGNANISMLQTPALNATYNANWDVIMRVKKKHYSKEKAVRKDIKYLSRYLVNLKNIKDKNVDRY